MNKSVEYISKTCSIYWFAWKKGKSEFFYEIIIYLFIYFFFLLILQDTFGRVYNRSRFDRES